MAIKHYTIKHFKIHKQITKMADRRAQNDDIMLSESNSSGNIWCT